MDRQEAILQYRLEAGVEEKMSGSGAVGLAGSLSGISTAQAMLSAQANLQRGVIDLQQDLITQLLSQIMVDLGRGVHLNLLA